MRHQSLVYVAVIGLGAGPLHVGCGGSKSPPAKLSAQGSDKEPRRIDAGAAKRARQLTQLCVQLECSGAQREAAKMLLSAAQPEQGGPAPRAVRSSGNAALASSFLGDAFSTAALSTYRATARAEGALGSAHRAMTFAQAPTLPSRLAALHASLGAAQREVLASLVDDQGLRWLAGSSQRGGVARRAAPTPGRRATRATRRLCRRLDCDDAQQRALATVFAGWVYDEGKAPKPARSSLGAALRAPTLEPDAVKAFFKACAAAPAAHDRGANDAAWVQVQGLLNATQRQTVATRIERVGDQALVGRTRRRPPGPRVREAR